MKNGKYRLVLEVELNGAENHNEALRSIAESLIDLDDNDQVPEAFSLDLLEEFEAEYETEEEALEELDFEQAG